jgi:hypothetical protein
MGVVAALSGCHVIARDRNRASRLEIRRRIYGNTAINTGYYTFSYVKDGESKSIPARYSLTFVNDGDKWMIVDHHSSTMPPAPAPPPTR